MLLAMALAWYASCQFKLNVDVDHTYTAKAFPPAKVIFTGISVLLGVRALALPFVDQLPLILNLIGGEGC